LLMDTVKRPVEQRILLSNVSWETYERLLADHLDSSVPHFNYDRGMLEIMSPNPEHEKINRTINLLVEIVAEEMGLDTENLGSTTFRREDLKRGFEPDTCFYVQNEERIRGKARLDLTVDPPPDLVIEIDITSPSLDKFPIYARIGVPEVWRYDGEKIAIFRLEGNVYAEAPESAILPPLSGEVLSGFVEEGKVLGRTAWLKRVREWARKRIEPAP
jgi:Uma2 family endonuclease